MTAIARLAGVTLDCAQPKELADFYHAATGLEVAHLDDDSAYLTDGGPVAIAIQRVEGFTPPQWPGQQVPQQLHLDLAVTDLDEAESRLLELGATKPDNQPNPQRWRVLLDPAGHPFCLAVFG